MGSIPRENMKMLSFYVVFELQNVQESIIEISSFQDRSFTNYIAKKIWQKYNKNLSFYNLFDIYILQQLILEFISKVLIFRVQKFVCFSRCFRLKQIFTNLTKYRFETSIQNLNHFLKVGNTVPHTFDSTNGKHCQHLGLLIGRL